MNHYSITSEQIAEMRFWLQDCGADLADRTDGEIVAEVESIYDGGVAQFLRDAEPQGPAETDGHTFSPADDGPYCLECLGDHGDELTEGDEDTCGCGFEIVWTGDEWQHDAAPWRWGGDHEAAPQGMRSRH